MLERPALSDDAILAALRQNYALDPRHLDFLPIGNDLSSYVYQVEAQEGVFFLKVKTAPLYLPALTVPRFLRDQGLRQVVAPLPARSGELSTPVDAFSLILYPFIAGRTGMEQGLTPAQWQEFGAVLAQIHAVRLPAGLAASIHSEDFRPIWGGLIQEYAAIERFAQQAYALPGSDPLKLEFAACWREKDALIRKVVARCARLAGILRGSPPPLVLCHTDIHTANLLVDPQGELHIIDWDHPKLAPREHDLSFVGGTLSGGAAPEPHEADFRAGYGPVQVDRQVLAFYALVWAVQEIGDYAARILATPPLGPETRLDSLRGFQQLFDPGDVIDQALSSPF